MYLLPNPKTVIEKQGSFMIRLDSRIFIDSLCSAEIYNFALILQKEIAASTGLSLPILRRNVNNPSGCIYITSLREGSAQSYELTIEEDHITIKGSDNSGILYGVQTLRQIIRQSGAILPALSISDAPSMPCRGFYFDTSRGRVPTLEYLKKLANILSFYKYNQVQLYIEHSYLFDELNEMWRDDTPLTAEDILELDRYCRDLQIELVPSLASFGHLYKLLCTKTYHHLCELEGSDTAPFSLDDRMMHHTIDVTNPESFELIKSLLTEYMQLFTSRHFNICADETFDLGKGKSKKESEEKGVTAVYIEFLTKISGVILENGRIPMFWSDVICEKPKAINQLPEELICLHWDYAPDVSEERLLKLIHAGAKKLYVCPGTHGWNHLINAHHNAYENISRMCYYGHRYHSMGALTTDWGDFGHVNHPEFSRMGLIYGGAFSWSNTTISEEEINRQISVIEYGDITETLCSIFRKLSECEAFPWYHIVRVLEIFQNTKDAESASRFLTELNVSNVPEYNSVIDDQITILYTYLGTSTPYAKSTINAYIIAAEGQKLFNLLLPILKNSLAGESNQIPVPAKDLASMIEKWIVIYKALWKTTSKESEFYRISNLLFFCTDYLRTL
ncbi:MAG: family 20 glycosylhydrolase [Lachnospiraceae bacterium]|nr:family 20 glycosylhydrolase [Lachnospiraceae bacterium]